MAFLSKIFGDANERFIKNLQPLVDEIATKEPGLQKLSDEELKRASLRLRGEVRSGKSLDDVLPDAFALVREASRRTLKQRHYDEQLLGGIVLHKGMIGEMRTGEGKTLVATLPVYLNALTGEGAHVVTVNDYLARRDAVWMGQIYDALGLTVGCINHEKSYRYDPSYKNEKEGSPDDRERDEKGSFHIVQEFMRPCFRKDAYAADITYGTNNEYGFDYLRDNMVHRAEDMVQLGGRSLGEGRRGHHFAIVDEVDSILIDEARTPLIISAPDAESPELYKTFAGITPHLKEDVDYKVDRKFRSVQITEEGIEKVEKILGVGNIYEEKGIRFVHHLEQSLRAQALFHIDKDYVVRGGEVIIVDEFTGRMMPGRRWSDGLHQAVEAKEGVRVQQESRTLATITFQNYFRLYKKLSGMTGTAQSSAEEFHKVYNLDVITVPTHRAIQRKDLPDLVFKTQNGKFTAVIEEIKKRHASGQPVLVGTVSIEKNEKLSGLLRVAGIKHELLNAKNHEKEAEIIAQAGKYGAVTIATNMAGRGVDIILGGNPPDAHEAEEVRNASGLHVIGTERHEARRIDNQLRGRAGRQGDPGSSQFYVSLEDEIMRVFGGERIQKMMTMLDFPEDMPLEHRMVSKSIESAQEKIEGFNFDSRKHILEYDDVMNKQREAIYKMRREILLGDQNGEDDKNGKNDQVERFIKPPAGGDSSISSLRSKIYEMAVSEVSRVVDMQAANGVTEEVIEGLITSFAQLLEAPKEECSKMVYERITRGADEETIREELKTALFDFMKGVYEERAKKIGDEPMKNLEKAYILQAIDMLWMDHLDTMDHLRDSVKLRAYGQRDPLVEYKNEAIRLFRDLQHAVQSAVVTAVFRIGIQQGMSHAQPSAPAQPINLGSISAPPASGGQEVGSPAFAPPSLLVTDGRGKASAGRNDPCPCGSGKKYKKCHGQ